MTIALPEETSDNCAPAILPDGSTIIAAADGLYRVDFEQETVQTMANNVPHEQVAVARNGRQLICGQREPARVEARTVYEVSLSAEPSWVRLGLAPDQLLFSPDDASVAVVDWKNDVVVVLDSASGTEIVSLPAPQCWAAAWSPDGEQLAFTVMDDIHIANTMDWKTHQRLKQHASTVKMLAWSADGERLVSCGKDRLVCVWNPLNGRLQHKFLGHRASVQWVTISSDSRSLLSSDQDGQVNLWQLATGELLGRFWHGTDIPLQSMSFSGTSHLIALSHKNKAVRFEVGLRDE